MSSKIEFVDRAKRPGANVSALCREFEIARQTGHKWLKRFEQHGYAGLEEESRRPKSSPLSTAEEIVAALLALRAEHPRWGPKKLTIVLRRTLGPDTPSQRTVDRILRRFGQVRLRRKKRGLSIVERAPDETAVTSNDIWTIDFKGWWRTGNGSRSEPLTIRDAYSRFVLTIKLMKGTKGEPVRKEMTRLFRRYGIPKAIQCDNGSPFISSQSMAGLTQLSAWWVSLGIRIVRSRPGCPQDNGAHERMHVDVAGDLQFAPEQTLVAQQRACDRWRQTFNHVRPHEALGGKVPADLYKPSPTAVRPKPLTYPSGWIVRSMSSNGSISIDGEEYFISTALAGYRVGLAPHRGMKWRVWLYDMELGEIELAQLSAVQVDRMAS